MTFQNNTVSPSPLAVDLSQEVLLPTRSPRRYFGSKYYKAPPADVEQDQLGLRSIPPAARSPPAKLSTPRLGAENTWGSLGNIRRRSSPGTGARPEPSAVTSIDFEGIDADPLPAPRSVTAPATKTEMVPAFRHDPYSKTNSAIFVAPVLVEMPAVFSLQEANPEGSHKSRPPLAPPAPRSHQLHANRIPPALSNLHLSTVLMPRKALSKADTQATPRLHTPGSAPNTSRSSDSPTVHEKGCGLSTVGETPRSARTNQSTPRDLPESIDGPYRNLGGLGVEPRPGEVVHLTPRQGHSTPVVDASPMVDPMVQILPAAQQGKTTPMPPNGTLHESLVTVVDFCLYPTRAFPLNPSGLPTPPKETMVRMFIGQLPYNVTDMQLAWMAFAFGGGTTLHHMERITKLDRTKKKQLPTGCYHFYVEPHHVDPLMIGLHKKVMVDDTGLWVAQNQEQDRILKLYSEQMKTDKTKRYVGRPYGTVVIQHSTSTFDPEAPPAAA